MIVRGIALVLLGTCLATAAWCRDAPTQREIEEHACYGDAMTLCGEFVPDEGRITRCMEQKRAQLSPGCAALFKPDRN